MILSSGRTPKKSTNQNAAVEIIRVFCDAIAHIPSHRQLVVFHRLVDILGSCDHLHVTIMMLLGKLVDRHDNDDDSEDHVSYCVHKLTVTHGAVMLYLTSSSACNFY